MSCTLLCCQRVSVLHVAPRPGLHFPNTFWREGGEGCESGSGPRSPGGHSELWDQAVEPVGGGVGAALSQSSQVQQTFWPCSGLMQGPRTGQFSAVHTVAVGKPPLCLSHTHPSPPHPHLLVVSSLTQAWRLPFTPQGPLSRLPLASLPSPSGQDPFPLSS